MTRTRNLHYDAERAVYFSLGIGINRETMEQDRHPHYPLEHTALTAHVINDIIDSVDGGHAD